MKIQNNPYLTYIDIIHILQNSNMVNNHHFFLPLFWKGGGGASQKLLANLSSTSRRDLSHSIKVAQL